MAQIVGRKQELKELVRLQNSDESEMVVVYGRRRVGKTFLINRAFADTGFTFKVTGLYHQKMKMQLDTFSLALKDYFRMTDNIKFNTWLEAFDALKQSLIKSNDTEKKVLFFDELPWFDTKGSNFLAALEWFWNGWASARGDIMMIVCGSATNWIINKFFKHKGGLYNRAGSKIFLKPFTLNETEEYLIKQGFELERYDIAQIYMIMGGIPYYLKQLDPRITLSANIDECFFKKNGKLWDEFENLFETLFSSSDMYIKIVQTLAGKQIGLTREEIISAAKLFDNGKISRALSDLEKCGFIRAYKYYGRKTKSKTYQLADFYTLFYFRFIKDNYGNDDHFWAHILDTPKKNNWAGYSFEQLIKTHIEQVKRALGIGFTLSELSSWYAQQTKDGSRGAQIDLVIDRRDRAINICEAKFYSSIFTIDKEYALNLRNKVDAFREATATKKTLVPTMITTFGIKQNTYSNFIQQQVTIDDLF